MNQQSWRIRHIRHPQSIHQQGFGAPAITVLWRLTGIDGSPPVIEYRVALCSPKDQFSRKKGIAVALAKESQFVAPKEEFQLVDILLDYQSKNKLRPVTLQFIGWFITETYQQKLGGIIKAYQDKINSFFQ